MVCSQYSGPAVVAGCHLNRGPPLRLQGILVPRTRHLLKPETSSHKHCVPLSYGPHAIGWLKPSSPGPSKPKFANSQTRSIYRLQQRHRGPPEARLTSTQPCSHLTACAFVKTTANRNVLAMCLQCVRMCLHVFAFGDELRSSLEDLPVFSFKGFGLSNLDVGVLGSHSHSKLEAQGVHVSSLASTSNPKQRRAHVLL